MMESMFTKTMLLASLALAAFAASPVPIDAVAAVICFPPPPSCYGCHSDPPYPCQDNAVPKDSTHAVRNAVRSTPLTRKQTDAAIAMVLGGGKTSVACICLDNDGSRCCHFSDGWKCEGGSNECIWFSGKGPLNQGPLVAGSRNWSYEPNAAPVGH